jgi:hypothetical protein
MTKSQLKSIVAGAATALATLDARMDLLTAILPPKYAGWLRTTVIVGGVIVMIFNQSLHPGHKSLPVAEVAELERRAAPQAVSSFAPPPSSGAGTSPTVKE